MERAISEVGKAIKLDPLNASFHHQLGTIYQGKGALEEAIQSFEKAISLNPFISHYHSSLGNALWAKSRGRDETVMNEAVASFERARDHFPASVRHRLILAIMYKRVGRKSDALAEYEKVLTLDYERALKIEPWLTELKDELAAYSRE
jgi:Tfp pilus assembly protein PilF